MCAGCLALAGSFTGMLRTLAQAEHLREILTSLGPAFVKIGQVTGPTGLMR